jgi:hypothetical protein
MSFFKRFAFTVKDDESVVCTAEELEQLQEDTKKRRKKKEDEEPNGEHPSNSD